MNRKDCYQVNRDARHAGPTFLSFFQNLPLNPVSDIMSLRGMFLQAHGCAGQTHEWSPTPFSAEISLFLFST
jgi:hypothetical protein